MLFRGDRGSFEGPAREFSDVHKGADVVVRASRSAVKGSVTASVQSGVKKRVIVLHQTSITS